MTNQKLRQAWQAAIDIEPIMKNVAGGKTEFYRMDSSLAPVEISAWHTKMSGLPWNEHNRDKAKRLLQEAGYKQEPIRFMTTQEYKWMYDFALLSKQQLEDAGFNIDLQVVDWATLVKRRNNSKEYDVFTTGMGAFYDPTHHIYLTPSWPGWTTDEGILKIQQELARETDPKKRMALWEQQTRQFYEKVPVIRYGDLFGLRAARNTREGLQRVDRARALLQCLAGEIDRGLVPSRALSGPSPPRRHPGDGGGGDGGVPAHPPDPRRSGERDAGARRDADPDRGHPQGARARSARCSASSWASTAACCAATSASPTSSTGR